MQKTNGRHQTDWLTISTDEYESMISTLEILSSQKAMEKIRKGEEERLSGRGKNIDKVKKELGL